MAFVPKMRFLQKAIFLPFYLFLFCAIFLNFIVQYHFDGLDYLKFEPVAFVSIHRTD